MAGDGREINACALMASFKEGSKRGSSIGVGVPSWDQTLISREDDKTCGQHQLLEKGNMLARFLGWSGFSYGPTNDT